MSKQMICNAANACAAVEIEPDCLGRNLHELDECGCCEDRCKWALPGLGFCIPFKQPVEPPASTDLDTMRAAVEIATTKMPWSSENLAAIMTAMVLDAPKLLDEVERLRINWNQASAEALVLSLRLERMTDERDKLMQRLEDMP